MIKKSQRTSKELLPFYVNGSLAPKESKDVDVVLTKNDWARADVDSWKGIQTAITNQPQRNPSSFVWQRVVAVIHEPVGNRQQMAQMHLGLLAGLLLAFCILILLWFTVRPGVVLQWSLDQDGINSYRIFRASHGSNQFELITEIASQNNRMTYTYVDAFLIPGKDYIYRVEGVRVNGESVFSQKIPGRYLEILPGQLALIFTSLVAGFGITFLGQYWLSFSSQKAIRKFA